MSSTNFSLANPLAVLLDKKPEDFRRMDCLDVIKKKNIERITFHYTALDGRLKELKLPVSDLAQAERVLAQGERVDGSSLFKGIVEPGLSDLYVVPEYKTAFLNPFDEKSLDFICRYLNKDGQRAPFAPDNILQRAYQLFQRNSGLTFHSMGELEFFLVFDEEKTLFPMEEQRGYHESSPFLKGGPILNEMGKYLAQITGAVKYAHSEVGSIETLESELDEINEKRAEQMEIEFLPRPATEMADFLVLARWLVRNVAYRHGCLATFAPKIKNSAAGNGLHVHLELKKDGENVMLEKDQKLSEQALRLIGGLCAYGDSLTAFGNTVASSYFRLVPEQEAPTQIYWSDLDRNALIRVPLAWSGIKNIAKVINPGDESEARIPPAGQTVEFRCPDGSAWPHFLLAGIIMSADWSMKNDESLDIVQKHYSVKGKMGNDEKLESFPSLPKSCSESSQILSRKRKMFEKEGVFPSSVIDYVVDNLKKEEVIMVDHDRTRNLQKLMHKDLHKH
ncbi:glutamine synthetase [bacterium]|nr:glutamine synthetase [bacterium]